MSDNIHVTERTGQALYASRDSDPQYRLLQAPLHERRREISRGYFGDRLADVHIDLGRTAHRSLCHCERLTGSGAQIQFSINAGLAFGTRRDWVVNPWPPATPASPPAVGTWRMLEDLLFRQTVRQHVIEIDEPRAGEEDGYDGFGAMFREHANRIGSALDLGHVELRNRPGGEPVPLAKYWPHCLRGREYYGDDITQELFDMAAGTTRAWRRGRPAPPGLGLLQLLQFLHRTSQFARATRIIDAQVDWLRRTEERRALLQNLRVERGELDVDGETLIGFVGFDRAWLAWNDATVRHIAEAADRQRDFYVLPILADALEEAGCQDARILRHLRAPIEHTRDCWVLRRLIGLTYSL